MSKELTREDEIVKRLRYHFSDAQNSSYVGPMKFSLSPKAQEALDDAIECLLSHSTNIPCPGDCKGAGRIGVSIDGTGCVEHVNCTTCDGVGVVPRGTPPRHQADDYYIDRAQAQFTR